MGLPSLLFNALTFPGLLANEVVQGLFEQHFGAPTRRFAVPDDLDEEELEANPGRIQEIRELDDAENPEPHEQVQYAVDYEGVEQYSHLFWLVLGPFFVTSVLALLLFGVSVGAEAARFASRQENVALWLVLFYPGFAVAAHAFPNSEPTNALYDRSETMSSPLRLVGYPIVAVSKAVNALRFLWVDALYAIGLYLLVAIPVGAI